jgi:hypothetical protein
VCEVPDPAEQERRAAEKERRVRAQLLNADKAAWSNLPAVLQSERERERESECERENERGGEREDREAAGFFPQNKTMSLFPGKNAMLFFYHVFCCFKNSLIVYVSTPICKFLFF